MPRASEARVRRGEKKLLTAAVCGAACLLAVVVMVSVAPRDGLAARAASCTFEEKQAQTEALVRRTAAMAAERKAYFKRHRSKAQRAAFVKRQQQKLSALRAAAACSVPPLPPSSGQSCSFTLAKNVEAARGERSFGSAFLNEGPITPAGSLPSRGHVRTLVLMVEFPDAPGSGPAAGLAEAYRPDPKYFDEVSYGRFSISVGYGDRWIKMPRPTSSYVGRQVGASGREYMRDAVAAADPFVDFFRYDFVFVVPTSRWAAGINIANHNFPGFGAPSAEGEVRFGATLSADTSRFGPGTMRVADHEFIHSLGLPDIYDDPTVGTWDPEGAALGGPPPGTHMLGWHKWRLGWLDPDQLTCLSAPGQIEETLTPLATAGGKKLVVVPTTPSTAYVIEARLKLGYDRSICEEGVLVYDADSQIMNGQTRGGRGVINMKGPRRCPAPATPAGGALHTREVFEDASVKVEVLARDASAFRVRITKK